MNLRLIAWVFLIAGIVSNYQLKNPHLGLLFNSTSFVIFLSLVIEQFKRKKNEE